jgi:hypothetical protein
MLSICGAWSEPMWEAWSGLTWCVDDVPFDIFSFFAQDKIKIKSEKRKEKNNLDHNKPKQPNILGFPQYPWLIHLHIKLLSRSYDCRY